ncbi:hypothetical protein N801_17250 [Knoellia aerolata DSM 18566]|uniref:DUF2877 domain-containing protein n=1 Tax=Knoellia aerolata DSM 18566 TaxID=1385519 RepID=A0A0A0JZ16_9MICO|nr:hypothetical protein N801_17250 [Knoellia aerolata DSM 18566]
MSPLVRGLVAGRLRPAVVLAAFPSALYLALADGDAGHADVVAVVTSDALVLPTSILLATPSPHPWGVVAGDVVMLGGDVVALRGHGIRVVRSWRPRRVGTAAPSAATVDWRGLLADVGRGEGLTPRADDVLCGALLAARAVGIAGPETLPLERTTSLSASLLVAASEGYAVSCVVDHVAAAVAGSPDVERTREQVLAIGHTSGAGLVEGIDLVLHAATSPQPEGILS